MSEQENSNNSGDSVSLEALVQQAQELNNTVLGLELEVKRLEENLKEKIRAFDRNSGALTQLQILINYIVEKKQQEQESPKKGKKKNPAEPTE